MDARLDTSTSLVLTVLKLITPPSLLTDCSQKHHGVSTFSSNGSEKSQRWETVPVNDRANEVKC